MIFSPLNLKQALIHERMRQQKLMSEVHELLEDARQADERILRRLRSPGEGGETEIELDEEDRSRLFQLKEIRKTCIRFRLRFLRSSYYKGAFPYEALAQIKDFERKHGVTLNDFMIIAPDHAFELENINKDPLLFARLSDDSYYFLHQWGKDLAWYKKFIFLPLQTPVIFFVSLFVCCGLLSLSIPAAWMNVMNFESEVYLRLWLMIHFFIMSTGIVLWLGVSFSKNFSCNTWNSKYYNW